MSHDGFLLNVTQDYQRISVFVRCVKFTLVAVVWRYAINCHHSDWLVPVGFCQFDIGEKVSTGEVFRPACVDQCVSYLNRTVISVDR